MKSNTKAGFMVVYVLIGIALLLYSVVAEAAIYVNGKKCASTAYEQENGNWKCRTVDNEVAEGPGYCALKLQHKQKIRKEYLISAPDLPNTIPEMAKPAMAK
jgi:hypothetical protein